jgi:hypothetical protein
MRLSAHDFGFAVVLLTIGLLVTVGGAYLFIDYYYGARSNYQSMTTGVALEWGQSSVSMCIHVLALQTITLTLKLHRHVRSLFRDHDRVAGTRKVVTGRAHFGELPEAYEAEGAV